MLPRPRQTPLRIHSSPSSATPKKLSLAQTPYSRQQGGGNNAKFGRFHINHLVQIPHPWLTLIPPRIVELLISIPNSMIYARIHTLKYNTTTLGMKITNDSNLYDKDKTKYNTHIHISFQSPSTSHHTIINIHTHHHISPNCDHSEY